MAYSRLLKRSFSLFQQFRNERESRREPTTDDVLELAPYCVTLLLHFLRKFLLVIVLQGRVSNHDDGCPNPHRIQDSSRA
jgi:hypothetical protein